MANGASRIFNIIKSSNIDTKSNILYLTVKNINPLTVQVGDKLLLTEEFLILSEDIIKERIKVGDVLMATTYDNGQTYYIMQTAKSDKSLKPKIIDNLTSTSEIDCLSANQGRILYNMIQNLQNQINNLS